MKAEKIVKEIADREAKQASSVVQEFSRFAHQYNTYNMIQAKVATTLIAKLPHQSYKNIIDIGSGSGEVYKNLQKQKVLLESFVALDSAESMLAIHPDNKLITKICTNFNNKDFIEDMPKRDYDLLLSSSALQWSTDLVYTMRELSLLSSTFYGALFTSGTFKTLHKTAGVSSPIYSDNVVRNVMNQFYKDVQFEMHHYSLEFNSTRDMFKYIKQSGVSSGERKLNYKQTKALMENYPLNYLEFEVLFIEAKN
jgi:malonyl-CoA O-methyltransferase